MLILDTILGVLRSLAPSNRRYHSFRNYSLEAFRRVAGAARLMNCATVHFGNSGNPAKCVAFPDELD